MNSVIKVNSLSKKYLINHQKYGSFSYGSLREDFVNVLKKPVFWLKGQKETKEDFWALKNVNFKVEQGEILGIIGSNGAGKSTLLKLLTRITPPSEGEAIIRGRINSLLEVGIGFHPELTGRENIYLNGSILGMRKKEIDRKFNEIVDFAGIERFLDTPAKRYSSGMYVRLAFSVAAHLEPDILLVDEVLSVGDATFQKKSLRKMEEITKRGERTILFVSHHMGAIQNLCNRCILLEKGEIKMTGEPKEVINEYLNKGIRTKAIMEYPKDNNKKVKIRKITILDNAKKPNTNLDLTETFSIEIQYDVNKIVSGVRIMLICSDEKNNDVFSSADIDSNPEFLKQRKVGKHKTIFNFSGGNNLYLNKGDYFLRISINEPGRETFDQVSNIKITLNDFSDKFLVQKGNKQGVLLINPKWERVD